MLNLDDTKTLGRMADALEKIAAYQEPVYMVTTDESGVKVEPLGKQTGGVPILLIVEVLCALIRLLRAWRNSKADKEILARQLARLEPFLPGAPVKVCLDGEEGEGAK